MECLAEGVEKGSDDASWLAPRFGQHLREEGGYGEPGEELVVV